MEIKAKITGIEYKSALTKTLKEFNIKEFDINNLPTSCIIKDGSFCFGLSKWVSPKRTRSYPYERVYNTLGNSKKITVIPIIKDEGKNGDRDFIQWDTISLMSLLDIFVVFSYYSYAEKHPTRKNKITHQLIDNDWVKQKINEIKTYHSSALHWNLKEIEKSFPELIIKAKNTFRKLESSLHIEFHSEKGIDHFAKNFIGGVSNFKKSSRKKAKAAQNREIQTMQPKESLSTATKAKIIIENYLGGEYYFTVDEVEIKQNKIFLIEAKHTKSNLLPSASDIKDGLIKMILYTNLKKVKINNRLYKAIPMIKLTSTKLVSSISSSDELNEIQHFITKQNFSTRQENMIKVLFKEAKNNNFLVQLKNHKND